MKDLLRRVTAVLLATVMSFVFIPLFGEMNAFAGGGHDLNGLLKGGDSSGSVAAGNEVYVLESELDDKYGESIHSMWNSEVALRFYIRQGDSSTFVDAQYDGTKYYYVTKEEDAGKTVTFFTETLVDDNDYNNNTNSITVVSNVSYLTRSSVPDADGSFTLTGHCGPSEFTGLDIYDGEGKYVTHISQNGKDFSYRFDVSGYKPGLYNMTGTFKNGDKVDLSIKGSDGVYYKTYFQVPIASKPTIKRDSNYFSTGYNYVCFMPYFSVDPDCGAIYLQLYDTKTGEWGDVYGPFGSYERLRTDYFTGDENKPGIKIQPNRTYKARAFYGKTVKYNGSAFNLKGPYSDEVTFKTGKNTVPAVKSITVKAVSQKKTKLITKAHWDVYGKWVPYKESYIWTTTYKVTVKLKKKPGAAGIMIGDKRVKGNKKTYTATFKDSGKLKGKKIKIGVCTYNDSKVGGYGKVYKKKVKVK